MLSILRDSLDDILLNDDYTGKALFFLEGLGKETPDHSQSRLQGTDTLLGNVSWNIRHEPWEAQIWKDGEGKPVDFSATLFDHDISLIVSSRYGEQEMSIPASGRTTYDVLKTIHDFYRTAEARYEEVHEDIQGCDDNDECLEEYGWNMGDGIFFEGIFRLEIYSSSWSVLLGS